MKNDFNKAIGKVGGIAVLPWLGNAAICVSIQPDGFYGGGWEETGSGAVCRYKFFTPYNEIAEKIREGGELVFQERRYLVENVATAYVGSRAAFRKGTLLLERDGGQQV